MIEAAQLGADPHQERIWEASGKGVESAAFDGVQSGDRWGPDEPRAEKRGWMIDLEPRYAAMSEARIIPLPPRQHPVNASQGVTRHKC